MGSTPERRRSGTLLTLVGVVLMLAAAVGVAYPLWWQHNATTAGSRLLNEPLTSLKGSDSSASRSSCEAHLPSRSSSSTHLAGILQIPSLGLRAPVLQGVGDPVLNVAVGHDPASPWPGALGESIVEAHDVSYFSRIDSLKAGTRVEWQDGCVETVFRVTSATVTTPGTLIQAPSNGKGLALVTCYPTDALFWTPDRYVVETAFVSSESARSNGSAPQFVTHLSVPAPPALLAEGLTLQDNPILLGKLSIAGSPNARWRQGPAPLDVEADALESFFGAEKAIAAGNAGWWRDLALPGLGLPRAWTNASQLYVTIDVSGTSVSWIVLHSEDITMRLVVAHDQMLIASVSRA